MFHSSKTQNQTQWQRFHAQLQYLNAQAPAHVQYKLLFLGRHGQGWHNAAEDYYGTPAWNVRTTLILMPFSLSHPLSTNPAPPVEEEKLICKAPMYSATGPFSAATARTPGSTRTSHRRGSHKPRLHGTTGLHSTKSRKSTSQMCIIAVQ
jgi:hypothetical protein